MTNQTSSLFDLLAQVDASGTFRPSPHVRAIPAQGTPEFATFLAESMNEWGRGAARVHGTERSATPRGAVAVANRPDDDESAYAQPTEVEAPAPPAPAARPANANAYPGDCRTCGQLVPAGAGTRGRKDERGWIVNHLVGQCPEAAAVPEANEAELAANARRDDYHESRSHAGPGVRANRYEGRCTNCKRIVAEGQGTLERNAADTKWVTMHREGECPTGDFHGVPEGRYAREVDGVIKFYVVTERGLAAQGSSDLHHLTAAVQVGLAEAIIAEGIEACARRYGVEIGECCRCGRTLTSEWRLQGIGPVCVGKAGW